MKRRERATAPSISRVSLAAALLALAGALALALAGCGGGEPATGAATTGGTQTAVDISGTAPVGEDTAGSVAQLVQCRDWNRADPGQRLATIADVRSQINLKGTGVKAPALSDAEAQEVFDNACSPSYAQGYRLYVIYARAAAFKPLKDAFDRDLGARR